MSTVSGVHPHITDARTSFISLYASELYSIYVAVSSNDLWLYIVRIYESMVSKTLFSMSSGAFVPFEPVKSYVFPSTKAV